MPEEVHPDSGLSPSFQPLLLIPAIDLLGGRCVRLHRGSYDRVSLYDGDPVEVARGFEAAGARRLHIVDLDAARKGAEDAVGASLSGNRAVIRRIRAAVRCLLQVGGGVRTERDVEELREIGADYLIVGTALALAPASVAGWCERHGGGAFLAGIDARGGSARVRGWEEAAGLRDVELAVRARELGLGGVVYTSIARDGTLAGPDLRATNRVAEVSSLPVILSGGVGSPAHVEQAARKRHPGVCGLILGKALYEGTLDLRALLRAFAQPAGFRRPPD